MHELIWVIVVVAAIAVLLALAGFGLTRRRPRPFEIHRFAESYTQPYASRIEELERMFVSQPREAVAAAKLLVDDMLARQGYPVRLSESERVADIKHHSSAHADRYRAASRLKSDPTTEELRRSLQSYLEMAREMLDDHRKHYSAELGEEYEGRPRLA